MSIFFNAIEAWKNKGKSAINNYGSDLICLVHESKKDDYLHVLFHGLEEKNKQKLMKACGMDGFPKLEEYLNLLSEHNGCILYSGAIVMFGLTNNNGINTFQYPPSIEKLNSNNRFVMDNPVYLFIGNLMHSDYSNVNIYINKKTGYILWMHGSDIFNEFENIGKMLDHVLEFYEPHYKENGENKDYNNRKKNVYENIQLY